MCLFLYSKQILTTTTKHQGAEAGNILSRKYLGDCPCPPDDTQALAAKFRIQVLLFVHKRIIILGDLLQPRRGKNISPHQTHGCARPVASTPKAAAQPPARVRARPSTTPLESAELPRQPPGQGDKRTQGRWCMLQAAKQRTEPALALLGRHGKGHAVRTGSCFWLHTSLAGQSVGPPGPREHPGAGLDTPRVGLTSTDLPANLRLPETHAQDQHVHTERSEQGEERAGRSPGLG